MKIDSVQIRSVRKADLTIPAWETVTRYTEKCPLSVISELISPQYDQLQPCWNNLLL